MATSSDILSQAFASAQLGDHRASDAVFRVARSRIVSGEWPAGHRLDLDGIARELNVSQTPVREAVLRLGADGFITKLPYKGAVVRGVESHFVEEVFALRLRLEGLGARLAARWRTDAQLEEVQSILTLATKDAAKHDWDWQADANDRFHLLIAGASGVDETPRILGPLLRHTERFIMMLHLNIGMGEMEHSHQGVVHAIERRDAAGAERAIRSHLVELFVELAAAQDPPATLRLLPEVLSRPELSRVRTALAPGPRT